MSSSNRPSAGLSKQAASGTKSAKNAKPARDLPNKENEPATGQRETRERRVSAKVAAQLQEAEEEAARKEETAARRAARKKKAQYKRDKEAGITQDPNNSDLEERHDSMFTSHTVASKPAIVSALAQHASQGVSSPAVPVIKRVGKVPPPPPACYEESEPDESDPEDPEDDAKDGDEMRGRSLHRVVYRRVTSETPPPLQSLPPSRSPSYSRTPSPSAGHKHARSEDLDINMVLNLVKAQKINENTGRPKASDYDDVGKEVILAAANIYRCFISTIDGFPDSATEIEFVKNAWKRANDDAGLPPMALTPDIGKIIKQRGAQTRGEAKTKIGAIAETMYGFDSGHGRKTIAANRKLADDLKFEKGYIYKILAEDSRKGIYRHPIIQKGVNNMWFKNKRDEGIIYSDMFNPMPVPAIALILTAVECNVDEWVTGTKTDITFYADDYRNVYRKHIESLEAFSEATRKHQMLDTLQKRLHNYGRLHAGAPPTAYEDIPAIPMSAFKAALKEYEEDPETDDDGDMEL